MGSDVSTVLWKHLPRWIARGKMRGRGDEAPSGGRRRCEHLVGNSSGDTAGGRAPDEHLRESPGGVLRSVRVARSGCGGAGFTAPPKRSRAAGSGRGGAGGQPGEDFARDDG